MEIPSKVRSIFTNKKKFPCDLGITVHIRPAATRNYGSHRRSKNTSAVTAVTNRNTDGESRERNENGEIEQEGEDHEDEKEE